MLKRTLARVGGRQEISTWDEMRTIGHSLTEVLRVAVRTLHDTIGNMIMEWWTKNRTVVDSVRRSQVRQLQEDCVPYGDSTFFSTVLHWKKHRKLPVSSSDPDLYNKLSKGDFLHVVKKGLPTLLRHLIKTARVGANLIDGKTPLWLA